ncbi:hypothetical protein [Nonomuraea rhizosphaerae]|uniref:hypothetical protein n=1 Tax=Nonomuraea rhizosphaerae TaxID=2665663 RepID=UPI001C5D2661|nr:hypothetical protein [Nonomuraea rhizosphaerae]
MSEYPTGPGQPAPAHDEGTLQQGKAAAREVAGTAKERTAQVAEEAKVQTRRTVDELRERVRAQSDQQSHRAAQSLRQWSEDLSAMHEHGKPDSPASDVVRQVADQGHKAANYLEQNGLSGVVNEVQDFARRRPAAFLIGALAAGFLVGRVIKASGESSGTTSRPDSPRPLSDDGVRGPGSAFDDYTPRSTPTPVTRPEPLSTAPPGGPVGAPAGDPLADPLARDDTRPVPPLSTPPAPPTYEAGRDLP